MIRRLTVPLAESWSAAPRTPPGAPAGPPRAIRVLAVSDEVEAGLWEHLDRRALGRIDLLVSCGDLPPDYLSYLEGSLRVPLVLVTGNHDLDDAWRHEAARLLPARGPGADLVEAAGLGIVSLDWPGTGKARTRSQDLTAWRQVLGLALRVALGGRRPVVVASHVAPHAAGDARDVYHRGFRAYRWLAERLRPALWLHGHTTPASVPERITHIGPTTCVNVTGAYLVDLVPPGVQPGADADGGDRNPAG